MLETLHLVRPWWLLGLVPAIAIVLIAARRLSTGSRWESSIAPQLLTVLLEPGNRRGERRRLWAVAAAIAVAAVGLAGPAWERLPQPVEQRNDGLVVVLDLSLSMLSRDVAPSRIARARHKITDVLRRREEGFTGLVAYAGDAHSVSPLTDDARTIQNLLAALSPEMMPVFGSDVAAGLALARGLFANASMSQGRILLVTDGVERPADVANFANPRFPIAILGVGTASGGLIPLDFANQAGRVLHDDAGDPVVVRLDDNLLRSLADETHGRYRNLSLTDSDIADLLSTPLPDALDTLDSEREYDAWADMGFWVCAALLPITLLGFRRGVLAAACLVILPTETRANVWDDLWQRRDQQAYQALANGDAKTAVKLFENPQWRAAARYRDGDYPGAAQAFSTDESPTGLYNLANALALQGELERAIATYDEVLANDPSHQDAAFNKALLENLLQQQESAPQQDDSQDDGEGDGQSRARQSPPPDATQDEDTTAESDPQRSDGEDRQQPEEPANRRPASEEDQLANQRDEQRDALEQWLRRVPDDPGGLLRRKFRYESNQRMRRGDYTQRGTGQIW